MESRVSAKYFLLRDQGSAFRFLRLIEHAHEHIVILFGRLCNEKTLIAESRRQQFGIINQLRDAASGQYVRALIEFARPFNAVSDMQIYADFASCI